MSHQAIFLGTGEVAFSQRPCLVRTVLGSCVGVALYDPRNQWGGLCHFLLAQDPDLDDPKCGQSSTRFGEVAIPFLIRKMLQAGSRRQDLLAIIAGGSLLLDANEVFFVGERNIRIANQILDDQRIPVLHRDIGGDRGRRMSFHTHDGSYQIETIRETDLDVVTF